MMVLSITLVSWTDKNTPYYRRIFVLVHSYNAERDPYLCEIHPTRLTTSVAKMLVKSNLPLSPSSQKIFAWVVIQVHEMITHFDELWRGRFAEWDDFDLAALVHLEVFDERTEVSISGNEDHWVEFGWEFHCVDGQTHVPVCFLCTWAEDLEVFDLGFDTHLGECIEESVFVACFCCDHVRDCADELAAIEGFLDDRPEVDLGMIEVLTAVIEVLRVDENTDTLFFVFNYRHVNKFKI